MNKELATNTTLSHYRIVSKSTNYHLDLFSDSEIAALESCITTFHLGRPEPKRVADRESTLRVLLLSRAQSDSCNDDAKMTTFGGET
jgi:hypothetical protein